MRIVNKYTVKDFYGRPLGFIEEDEKGNKKVKDFNHRILGTYDKITNKTKDFYGRPVGEGDLLSMLLFKK